MFGLSSSSVVPVLLLRFQLNIFHHSHLSLSLPLSHSVSHLSLFFLLNIDGPTPFAYFPPYSFPNFSLLDLLWIILPLHYYQQRYLVTFFAFSLFVALSTIPCYFIYHFNWPQKLRCLSLWLLPHWFSVHQFPLPPLPLSPPHPPFLTLWKWENPSLQHL